MSLIRVLRSGAALVLLLGLLVLCGPVLIHSLRANGSALAALRHLTNTGSCAPDQVYFRWDGAPIPGGMNQYVRAAVAAAENAALSMPPITDWDRDPRLYFWFEAQAAVKQDDYPHSLELLQRAGIGQMLEAQGHPLFWSNPSCALIVWTLAHEVAGYSDPAWVVQHLVAQQDWVAVAEAYERLLPYEPENSEWRLVLARAYLALDRCTDALLTLQPLLNSPSSVDRQAAEALLAGQP